MHHLYAKEIYLLERRSEFLKELSWIIDQDDYDPFDLEAQTRVDNLCTRYKDVSDGAVFIKTVQSIYDEMDNKCNNDILVEEPLDT
jgi:hypothetical protein